MGLVRRASWSNIAFKRVAVLFGQTSMSVHHYEKVVSNPIVLINNNGVAYVKYEERDIRYRFEVRDM